MRAVVTGATNGIGEAIARRLASEGLTVTIVGRSGERLQAAGERIESAVPGADLVLERADLAELAQVRDLAGRLLAGPHPGAVISNAALVTPLDRMTSDGLPRVLAVNHLAPYLLLHTLAAAGGQLLRRQDQPQNLRQPQPQPAARRTLAWAALAVPGCAYAVGTAMTRSESMLTPAQRIF